MNEKHNDRLSPEQNLLCNHLQSMKMSKMAESLEQQYLNPNSDLRTFDERITEIIESEWQFPHDHVHDSYHAVLLPDPHIQVCKKSTSSS